MQGKEYTKGTKRALKCKLSIQCKEDNPMHKIQEQQTEDQGGSKGLSLSSLRNKKRRKNNHNNWLTYESMKKLENKSQMQCTVTPATKGKCIWV